MLFPWPANHGNKAGALDADFAPVIAITDRSRRTRPLSGQAGPGSAEPLCVSSTT